MMDSQSGGQSWKRRSIQIEKPKGLGGIESGEDSSGLSPFYKVLLVLSVLFIVGALAFFIFSDPLSILV